ncbi:hypothetical protein V5N11_003196 [Cardamine amara subsp. amara]|uniref:Uncharacterized protein n=1 Tax=Cardamine amara subsp. amara TaxID=228776 RepID=A0ABD0Z0C4_CARAN
MASCISMKDIATRLGICDIKDSPVDIILADASVKTSTGLTENLQVKIGDCLLSCDFHVVEMANDTHIPLILGRTFLATAGALVDLPSSRISSNHVDPNVFYGAISSGCAVLSPKVATEEVEKVSDREVNNIHSNEFTAKKTKSAVRKKKLQ